jgi:glycine cleavage system H protein
LQQGVSEVSDCEIPEDCHYTEGDEWVRGNADSAVIGITDYAQQQLGDIVFVELPEVGTVFTQGDSFGVIESVKAVSDLFAPISGSVVAVNGALDQQPEAINQSCYEDGWLIVLAASNLDEFDALMDAASYRRHVDDRDD